MKRLRINAGAIVVMGWQSCNRMRAVLPMRFCMRLQKNMALILDTPFQDYPEEDPGYI